MRHRREEGADSAAEGHLSGSPELDTTSAIGGETFLRMPPVAEGA